VWSEFSELGIKYGAVSLGQGSPFANPPQFVVDALVQAIKDGHNQYIRTFGHPLFCETIAKIYGPKLGRDLNPMTDILVGLGANGVLHSFFMGLSDPGDEAVLIEPTFPMYLDHLKMANVTVKTVPLEYSKEENTFKLNFELFKKAFSAKTKYFIFNNPNNPSGKCFTKEEIQQISDILDTDFPHVIILSDEVYDFLTFDSRVHYHMATFNNNWNKTVTVFSGGKIFNATGWKVGWAVGPAQLIKLGGIISNTTYFSVNAPQQVAFANSLGTAHQPGYQTPGNDQGLSYIQYVRYEMEQVRDLLSEGLKKCSLPIVPLACESGYFLIADISGMRPLLPKKYLESHDVEEDPDTKIAKYRLHMPDGSIPLDVAVCRYLALEKKVVVMPNSYFYDPKSPYIEQNYIRVGVCRGIEQTKRALERLV